jgi:hypothetical protein
MQNDGKGQLRTIPAAHTIVLKKGGPMNVRGLWLFITSDALLNITPSPDMRLRSEEALNAGRAPELLLLLGLLLEHSWTLQQLLPLLSVRDC